MDEACVRAGRNPREVKRSLLYVIAQMPEEQPWDSVDAFVDYVGRFTESGVQEFIYGRTGIATANFLNNPERFRSKTMKYEFNVEKATKLGYSQEMVEETILEAQERVLGPEHPDTLLSLHSLALLIETEGTQDDY